MLPSLERCINEPCNMKMGIPSRVFPGNLKVTTVVLCPHTSAWTGGSAAPVLLSQWTWYPCIHFAVSLLVSLPKDRPSNSRGDFTLAVSHRIRIYARRGICIVLHPAQLRCCSYVVRNLHLPMIVPFLSVTRRSPLATCINPRSLSSTPRAVVNPHDQLFTARHRDEAIGMVPSELKTNVS